MSYLGYFSISFEKKLHSILRFWLEKLNCELFHSFHLSFFKRAAAQILNYRINNCLRVNFLVGPNPQFLKCARLLCYRHHQSPQPSQIIMWLRYSISFLSTFFSEFFQGKDFNLDPIITWFWVFTCVLHSVLKNGKNSATKIGKKSYCKVIT